MKRKTPVLAAATLSAATLSAAVALAQPLGAAPATRPPPAVDSSPQPHDLPEGAGRAVVQTVCAQCHNTDVVTRQPRSREAWIDVMSRMIGNGAQLSDEEYNQTIDYLVMHYGPSSDGSRGR